MQLFRNFAGVSSCAGNGLLNACIDLCGQATLKQLGCVEAVIFKSIYYGFYHGSKAIHNNNEKLQVVSLLFQLGNTLVKLFQQCLCFLQLNKRLIQLTSHSQGINGKFCKLHFTLDFGNHIHSLLELLQLIVCFFQHCQSFFHHGKEFFAFFQLGLCLFSHFQLALYLRQQFLSLGDHLQSFLQLLSQLQSLLSRLNTYSCQGLQVLDQLIHICFVGNGALDVSAQRRRDILNRFLSGCVSLCQQLCTQIFQQGNKGINVCRGSNFCIFNLIILQYGQFFVDLVDCICILCIQPGDGCIHTCRIVGDLIAGIAVIRKQLICGVNTVGTLILQPASGQEQTHGVGNRLIIIAVLDELFIQLGNALVIFPVCPVDGTLQAGRIGNRCAGVAVFA